MFKRLFFATVAMCCLSVMLCAQEFRCAVQVNYQKLQTTTQQYSSGDTKVFESMKRALEEFVNGRRWTNLEFEQHEKIDCSISIVLNEQSSATDFKGQLQVQLRAPVFNSNYSTGLFNYLENDFQFSYNESQPIDFEVNTFYSNLSSAVAYYLYVMLGIYFDSYGMMGGEPFFDMAASIAQTAENSGFKGWRSSDGQKSRYWFMENHTNSAYSALHTAYYYYQRMGLDMMTKDQPEARKNILHALDQLREVFKVRPNLLSVTQFVDVKISEIVSIYTPAPAEEQKKVFDIIKTISPINANKLQGFATK
ncbi:MAG: DUF4835 family protein [Bacteroidales bacterium]|nr:DUF4835 family protein [Bacteroidales bacterium]